QGLHQLARLLADADLEQRTRLGSDLEQPPIKQQHDRFLVLADRFEAIAHQALLLWSEGELQIAHRPIDPSGSAASDFSAASISARAGDVKPGMDSSLAHCATAFPYHCRAESKSFKDA